jgi:dTDP-4-dehydrorhamnose 3,5-epimerase-like enzyme
MFTNLIDKKRPEIFEMSSIGESSLGFITVAEFPVDLPFEIKRVYWTYFTPQSVVRGFHAHKELYQLIFAVNGIIKFKTEDRNGDKNEFILSAPHIGLFIPPYVWREIEFSHNAVLLCLASQIFSEADYIRDYSQFQKYQI